VIMHLLIPSDEHGPGAVECGALIYLDGALAGGASHQREAYRIGLGAMDRYCRYSRGAPFLELSRTDQESVLLDLELGSATGSGAGFDGSSAAFFGMVKGHIWQAMFGDPYYGGNIGFAGWDLINYPGVRTMVTAEDQRRLEAGQLPPARRSAYESPMFNRAWVRTEQPGGAAHGD
jgi:gluconate 2-dehydrogenase gamma chain